jgi:hypothetical protein
VKVLVSPTLFGLASEMVVGTTGRFRKRLTVRLSGPTDEACAI